MVKRLYSIWKHHETGDYEVVLWKEGVAIVVQTNIKTRAKASEALKTWQQRENDRDSE